VVGVCVNDRRWLWCSFLQFGLCDAWEAMKAPPKTTTIGAVAGRQGLICLSDLPAAGYYFGGDSVSGWISQGGCCQEGRVLPVIKGCGGLGGSAEYSWWLSGMGTSRRWARECRLIHVMGIVGLP
jgi:hypothetical protein